MQETRRQFFDNSPNTVMLVGMIDLKREKLLTLKEAAASLPALNSVN